STSMAASANHAQDQSLKVLLARFDLRSDQADFLDARAAHDIDGTSDLSEFDCVIALDECHLLGTLLENIFQARAELVPGRAVLIDHHVSAGGNLNDNGLGEQGRILFLVR